MYLSVVGCATAPSADVSPPPDRTKAFNTAVQLLRDEGFPVNRRDARAGVITSEPVLSPTALEPWKGDNHEAETAWASTAGMLRRVVTVRINDDEESVEDSSGFRVEIEVQLERFQAPTRRVINGARGRVFTALWATPSNLADRGTPGRYWEPVDRDPALEARLTEALNQRLAKGPLP